MPARDLPLLIDAARIAGRVATSYAGPTARRWDKADGAGPVTEADLAVNAQLCSTLRLARPDYGWLSEETEDNADRLSRDRVFIIDPIDGTRSFLEGSDTWAHSIAIAEQGEITAAVVYLPLRNKLYAAAKGMGATCNGVPIAASGQTQLAQSSVLVAKPAMQGDVWKAGACPAFKRSFRPSLAYRLALVAEGRFEAMLTLRKSWEWDIAAGALIVAEAGGIAHDRTGIALRFNNPDPRLNGVVAGAASISTALIDALA
ncbi:3'(2'),5'-bisphosphate nucleotidase CysQ [Sulfitobacter sp. M57]|uniref:3'(2'),5'-bisphosphate nucleotidase CysQ n=1 Tax=unclassified Sulfitobacter TaxID=196795 RepID=UPI0023E1E9A3|nr:MULTISPECIES: 3'(2'),5'-bisphosphate nucleotidase CysQ [unclassified Sulfitobacter]MDF3415324.1 3'(2'),5'-bisphosphate nucleotidase CysQ [Sulfitobacter sp. KE5]MDF3422805.1 3'(2'),5'-bisphosphate nucleotidase CysQ [Sulfitobacter sp. KE43]MDF3433870.1 3'(2'),5'-bisphosphate nucleotidase CysQ [Sulfitobacter sp. KE42]MDF3459510.1 3'(2'),5'-bisphosphate nucleotidase CysQ [Sulfitobacter sp. S74]MDF3463409.1 3'(2'),5'-bisphosphate nucleotidase CysQ [Sulfitobacter sp. Ks18]